MMIKKRRRQVPGLNTTSTADISFMLLIFFLVTTSMDVDKGLLRQLPPAQNNQEQQVSEVEKSTLMAIKITPANEI
ncbi:MAG TPA: biopolymer transporter ExbD, partial [Prevotella sp.]